MWWAAGYFDSRGRVYIRPNQVVVDVECSSRELIERFADATGFDRGWIREKHRVSPARGRVTAYVLSCSSMGAAWKMLTVLRPLVAGSEMKAKMDAAIGFLAGRGLGPQPEPSVTAGCGSP